MISNSGFKRHRFTNAWVIFACRLICIVSNHTACIGKEIFNSSFAWLDWVRMYRKVITTAIEPELVTAFLYRPVPLNVLRIPRR